MCIMCITPKHYVVTILYKKIECYRFEIKVKIESVLLLLEVKLLHVNSVPYMYFCHF